MSAYYKYLDPADRDQLLLRLATLYADRLYDCPLEGRFPDRSFFELLREIYLREFPLETHEACRLKGILSRVSEQSKERMATSTPAVRRTGKQELEDLWGQLRHVFDLMVCAKKMQVVEKDLFRASKVCNSGIGSKSLLRPTAELMALLEAMKKRLLAIAKDKSSGHLPWLRSFKRDVSIRMENRRLETRSCTPVSDDGDDEYDDEKDGDLTDDDRTTNGDFEGRDATFSPGSRVTPFSSSPSARDQVFSSSPFPSSATESTSDDDDEDHCEYSSMTPRSPTPSPAERPSSVQGLLRLRPVGPNSEPNQLSGLAAHSNIHFTPFGPNTASIGPDDRCPSQHPPSSPLEPTNGNLASVEAPGSRRNAVVYVDLTEHDGALDHPVGEVFQSAVSAGNPKTARISKKGISPARNGVFEVAFPDGLRRLEAARDGYCGFHAIVRSFKAQYPHHPPPTVEALMDVLESRAMESIMETLEASRFTGDERPEMDFAYSNTDWFLQDHLAAIFRLWGQQVGLEVALGILTNNIPHLHDNDETDEETIVVWIEHNGIDHYDGLASETCQDDDDESARVPRWNGGNRSLTPRRSFASSGHHLSPDTSYDMVQREEASPHKEGSSPLMDSMPVEFDDCSFDALCRDGGSSERLEVPNPRPWHEDDCSMSDDSGTMRIRSRSTSPQLGSSKPFHQYVNLEGCEKMESSDLMMSGVLQPGTVGCKATPPTQKQRPTSQPTQPRKQAPRHSGGPGILSSFTLPHRPKGPQTTSDPPPKRQRHGLANRPPPGPCCHRSARCRHGRKRPRHSRRCWSEQPRRHGGGGQYGREVEE